MKKTLSLILMLVCILQGASVFVFAEGEDETVQLTEAEETAIEEAAEAEGSADEDTSESEEGDEETGEEIDPEAAIVNDGSAVIEFADESILEYTQGIYFSYLETGAVLNSWSFPYSDRFFEIPSSQFSVKMAQGSLGLAVSAFRSRRFDLQYETYLHQAGFYNLESFGYDKPTQEDSLSGVVGMKEVNGRTVIAAVTCGQGYKKEWAGNMKVGKGERHQGFNTGAQKLEKIIARYIHKYSIDGKKVLWITGMSRAAAIANLTAADAIESGEYDDVYAYLFGVPRVTKDPVKYKGIYNICGQYDAVPAIPMQTWGFERYGIDLYTPSQEADDAYPIFAMEADAVGDALDGKGFRNNPEINYQLRLMEEYMGELFSSSEDYADRMQDIMVKAVNNHDEEEIMQILTEAFKTMKPKDKKEQRSLETAVNYISYIVAQHTRASQRQIDDGSWDPTESLASNLMLEHRPSTYVKWLFADLYPEEKFISPIESRRVTINGKVGVTVYEEGYALTAIDENGRIYSPDPDIPDVISGEHSIFTMRNGEETVISLPYDHEYTIEISCEGIRNINYLDVIVTPEKLVPKKVTIFFGRLRNGGTIRLYSHPGEPLSEPELVAGSYASEREAEYRYSPTVIMRNELQATSGAYLSLGGAISLVRTIVVILVVLFLACIIINIRHRRKVKKEGHPPYSDLYVIIPHIVCIAVFAFLTQFSTFFLYTIPVIRAQFAAATLFFITLLAARGTLKSKKPMAFLFTVLLGLLTYCTRVYYNELFMSEFSAINMIAFFLTVASLTAVAWWTFKRPETETDTDKTLPEPEKKNEEKPVNEPIKEKEEKPAKEEKKKTGKNKEANKEPKKEQKKDPKKEQKKEQKKKTTKKKTNKTKKDTGKK